VFELFVLRKLKMKKIKVNLIKTLSLDNQPYPPWRLEFERTDGEVMVINNLNLCCRLEAVGRALKWGVFFGAEVREWEETDDRGQTISSFVGTLL
jgi:hypothetical protein